VVAILQVPSDHAGGMSDLFRTSEAHAADIRAVIDVLDQRWPGPHFLVGTSRGTVSTAYLGTALDDPRVRGLVLTASLVATPRTRPELRSLRDLPLEQIRLPVLFVHHRHDGCGMTQLDDALRQFQRIVLSPRRDFVEVQGGDPPRSDPCEAFSEHGFLGREVDVVRAITGWAAGRSVPGLIGQ
jgi:pimeloyl-ACP methyl ester carboxylesterase